MGAETGWRAVGIPQHVYRSLIVEVLMKLHQGYIPES